ncbi:hypothetical protein Trydic_g15269 [Trypoxylus dichotomus]
MASLMLMMVVATGGTSQIRLLIMVADSDTTAPKSDMRSTVTRLHLSQKGDKALLLLMKAAGVQRGTSAVRFTAVAIRRTIVIDNNTTTEQTGQPTAQRRSYHDRCQPALREREP